MGIIDDIRLHGATARATDELLFAEALREVESGLRRDGLWAMALSQSNMNVPAAQALYLKLRVQSLRDEIRAIEVEIEHAQQRAKDSAAIQARLLEAKTKQVALEKREVELKKQVKGFIDLGIGISVMIVVIGAIAWLLPLLFNWLTNN